MYHYLIKRGRLLEILESRDRKEEGSSVIPDKALNGWISDLPQQNRVFLVVTELPEIYVEEDLENGIRWQIEPYLYGGYSLLREHGDEIEVEARGMYRTMMQILEWKRMEVPDENT